MFRFGFEAKEADETKRGYPGLGWTVVARRPLDVALAPANQPAMLIILIGLAGGIAGVDAARILSRRLTLPLAELAANMDRITVSIRAYIRV